MYAPNEPPLTDRELRVLRGIIDEHLYRESRNRFVRGVLDDVRRTVVIAAAVVLFGLQVATLAVTLYEALR